MAMMKSERLGRDFDVEIVHVGLVPEPWGNGKPPARGVPRHMDHWLVLFRLPNGGAEETVDYYTGLGHRKRLPEGRRTWHKDILSSDPGNWEDLRTYRGYVESDTRPVAPKLDHVLHSLSMDASAAGMSFEDWAGDLGYDTDSRAALATYEECQKSAKRLTRITGERDLGKIAEAFADY